MNLTPFSALIASLGLVVRHVQVPVSVLFLGEWNTQVARAQTLKC